MDPTESIENYVLIFNIDDDIFHGQHAQVDATLNIPIRWMQSISRGHLPATALKINYNNKSLNGIHLMNNNWRTLVHFRHLSNNCFDFRGCNILNGHNGTQHPEWASMGCNILNGSTTTTEENWGWQQQWKQHLSGAKGEQTTLRNINDSKIDIKIWNQHCRQQIPSKLWIWYCHLHRQDEQGGRQPTSIGTSASNNKNKHDINKNNKTMKRNISIDVEEAQLVRLSGDNPP